jgi:DNA-binding MarR family transcriptional regulator
LEAQQINLKITGHLLGGQLVRAEKAHERAASERLKEMGLYLSQELVLLSLEKEDGMTQSHLAANHDVDISTITKVVHRMERAGFVSCRPDLDDARISRVYLTKKGRSLCAPSWQMWLDLDEQLTRGLTEAEKVLLYRLLSIVASNLEQ